MVQADLLALAVEEARDQVASQPAGLVAAELPGLTYLAAGGAGYPPLALAGCCLCIYLGADVLDNVADRELPPRWAGNGPAQATLTGSTLLAASPWMPWVSSRHRCRSVQQSSAPWPAPSAR